MRRTVAIAWHVALSAATAALFVVFVIPRWFELVGATSHLIGTIARLVTGALLGVAALPVVFTLLARRAADPGTPRAAQTLRLWAVVGHVVAAVVVAVTALVEIWVSVDRFGPWLFGVYGGAGALALLAMAAFWLSFAAEAPPRAPKAPRSRDRRSSAPKRTRTRRRRPGAAAAAPTTEETAVDETGAEPDGDAGDPEPDLEGGVETVLPSGDDADAEPSPEPEPDPEPVTESVAEAESSTEPVAEAELDPEPTAASETAGEPDSSPAPSAPAGVAPSDPVDEEPSTPVAAKPRLRHRMPTGKARRTARS